MRKMPLAFGLVVVHLAASSCATKTEISGVWKSDSSGMRPMERMLVIGIAASDANRRIFEDDFSAALVEQRVEAEPSYRILPESGLLAKEAIQQAIRGRGFQGVLVTRLIQVDEREKYVPPTTYVSPGYYGRGLYGYYGLGYEIVHEPGYTVRTTIVRLETHLYDAASAELLWAAHSDTFNPKSLADGVASVTRKLSKQLAADGFAPRK